ncbi:MAG TPA: hypothetical protein PK466_13545 [Thermotogota bacterium]|nr:hypothetical protein [Thermotogota bacterium]
MNFKFDKSDQGSYAAWKGFSTQTLYIANRLIHETQEYNYYPETVEDLMIRQNDKIIELVQVKNLKEDFTLSKLSPDKNDSFFRRCLSFKEEHQDVILKVICFGTIGNEFEKFMNGEESAIASIKKKLLKINETNDNGMKVAYTEDEIDWLLKNLRIEKVEEQVLCTALKESLSQDILSMAAPDVISDVLTQYISTLSYKRGSTSKLVWGKKLQSIALGLASISGAQAQFGKTIFPLYTYPEKSTPEELKKEYMLGINARPQHLRLNLDIERHFWLEEIDKGFEKSKIVLIRGASGQGKSSLAYRYLLDNFPEMNVMCIEKITSEQQAIDIHSAILGIAEKSDEEMIVYIDVVPYDINWVWLVEHIHSHNDSLKLLITIREEDFRRSSLDYSKTPLSEIELVLSKMEANQIYSKYNSPNFLDFNEAWEKFGENGPLMEFMYLLNYSETLEYKLKTQIEKIITEEANASDDWIEALYIFSNAGKNNIPINLNLFFRTQKCDQRTKMLSLFEKEYFLKLSDDKLSISPLHTVRSKIIFNIIKENGLALNTEKMLLKKTLNSIEKESFIIVVEYIYQNGISSEMIQLLSDLSVTNHIFYANLIKAILWGETYNLYLMHRELIDAGNEIAPNFKEIFLPEITGYINLDLKEIHAKLKQINPEKYRSTVETFNKINPQKIQYAYLDLFLKNTIDKFHIQKNVDLEELTPLGFILFWMALRGFSLPETTVPLEFNTTVDESNYEDYLNFLIGVQKQGWNSLYMEIKTKIKPVIFKEFDILYFSETDEGTTVRITYDFSEKQIPEENNNNTNEFDYYKKIMSVVNVLHRLSIKAKKYNVELIGIDLVDGISIPDKQKNIPNEHIQFIWLTQINRWGINLYNYNKSFDSWNQLIDQSKKIRVAIYESIELLLKDISKFSPKNKSKNLLRQETIGKFQKAKELSFNNPVRLPKFSLGAYGILNTNKIIAIDNFDPVHHSTLEDSLINNFNQYFTYINNFYNNFEEFIIDLENGKNKNSKNGHLPLCNLIDSLKRLKVVHLNSPEPFSLNNLSSIDDNAEYEQLLLFTAIWDFLKHNKLSEQKSLIKKMQNYISITRSKICSFFIQTTKRLQKYGAVRFEDKKITACINIKDEENFVEEFIVLFKRQFKGIQSPSLMELLIKESFNNLVVYFKCGETQLPIKRVINIDALFIRNNYAEIMKYSPVEKTEVTLIKPDNEEYKVFKIYGLVNNYTLMLKHCSQVLLELSKSDPDYIIQETSLKWKENSLELLSSQKVDILKLLNSISSNSQLLPGEEMKKIKIFLDETKSIINQIDEALFLSIQNQQ